MAHLDDTETRIKLQRQLVRKIARVATDAGPVEFGDRARNLLAALQADLANMLRPPRTYTRHRRRPETVRLITNEPVDRAL